LRDPNSGQNWDCADTTTSNSGMFLDNTDANGPSSGWYNLEISSPGISSYPYYADWAAYETLAGFSTASTHSIKTPDEFTYILQSESDSFWLAMHSVTVDQVYEIQTDCTQDVWIYTNNIVKAYNSTSNPVGSSSNGSFTIPYGDCTSSMTLRLTPDEQSSIHFAILLLNPPLNVEMTIDATELVEGYSATITLTANRPLSTGESLIIRPKTAFSNYVSFSPEFVTLDENNQSLTTEVTLDDDELSESTVGAGFVKTNMSIYAESEDSSTTYATITIPTVEYTPPTVSITIMDDEIVEGSSGIIYVSLDRSLRYEETYVVDLSEMSNSSYVNLSPSSIPFDEYNSGPFSVQVTISNDYMTGVLGDGYSSPRYLEIEADLNGQTFSSPSSIQITEAPSP